MTAQQQEPLPECAKCGTPMRPWNTRIKDYPGTRTAHSGDKCSGCYSKEYRRRTGGSMSARQRMNQHIKDRLAHIESLPTEDDRIKYADPGLWKYIKARRDDEVPYTGGKRRKATT